MTYFHTVRHLKPSQLYGRVAFQLRRPSIHGFRVPALRDRVGQWAMTIARDRARTGPFSFCFLNEQRQLSSWNDPGIPKLWLYNLHYFEAPEADLIEQWIRQNPPAAGNGWEPYPLSLRIVNWIKFALNGGEFSQTAVASLAAQADFLCQRIEYHLLGNHILANAKALVFAGAFFQGDRAERWLTRGLAILNREIPEQILADGGHFERSPMYHSVILEDLLDLANLHTVYPVASCRNPEVCSKMLGWLATMTHPDGEIALYNDAAFGIAPKPSELAGYAARLKIPSADKSSHLASSGYVRLELNETVAFFDAAPVGPDYQPGHAHADTLSVELSHRGRRVLVNSGTSTYQNGPERLRQRGTAAHNTVRIDGQDQSEVWGAFRVARRAKPSNVRYECGQDFVRAEASHDGYRRLSSPVTHHRQVHLTPNRIDFTDRLDGRGTHSVELFFHLHPSIDARSSGTNRYSLSRNGVEIAALDLDPRLECFLESSTYHPEFGVSLPNLRISACASKAFPACFTSHILL